MKKIFVIITLLTFSTPVFADIINPHLTPEQVLMVTAQKRKMFLERQRNSAIQSICGTVKTEEDTNRCKKQLYNEYLETVKYLESSYGK